MASDVQESIQKLAGKNPTEPALDEAKKPDPILPKTGFGQRPGGGGISGPLTETSYTDRAFYSTFTVATSDGLFVMELKRVKTMKFTDGDGGLIKFEFKDKP